jgi:hypothetical protein
MCDDLSVIPPWTIQEWEDLVDHGADGTLFDETGDQPQLDPVRFHEEEGVANSAA